MRAKKPKALGVYAGSFDPLTIGHVWMIRQGVRLFDRFVVAIGINPDAANGMMTCVFAHGGRITISAARICCRSTRWSEPRAWMKTSLQREG